MNAPWTVLVADDEASIRGVVGRLLAAPGLRVIAARDGAEALALAAERRPDLILLDVHMPKMNGWEVLAELRRGPRTRLIPVILLTSAGAAEEKVGGLSLGADDYVTKPFAAAELVARVEGLLRRHEQVLAANPLTGLPGSPSIEEEVERRIREGRPFALFHADIDRFKRYNDYFGFEAGNRALLATAEVLRHAAGTGFTGHVGGDDFAAVVALEDAVFVAQRLVVSFDERAAELGHPAGKKPLTLSVGIATTTRRRFADYASAAAVASEMKAYLKSRPTRGLSRFAFDRRSGA